MPNPGKLKLVLTDVQGSPIAEDVDVFLRHQSTGRELRARLEAGKAAIIKDLVAEPDGLYRIEIDPPAYLPVSRFVNIGSNGATPLEVTFPIDPHKVREVEFPAYGTLADEVKRLLKVSKAVQGFEGKAGASLYKAVDDIRRAGFLNIAAKTLKTTFASGRNALSHVQQLNELRGDRFFAVVTKELREEAKNALLTGQFVEAPGNLHHPPEGFTSAGSFKSDDRYGNLQLTFFARGDEWRADIDIDDASGLEHVFQVLRNTLTKRPTHPYDIHELLLYHQQLDPGYSFVI